MSSGRHFPNFMTAYMEYATDGFCPDLFHYWTGISILAGALERKVWIPWSDSWHIFPNMYILLVSTPGMGKSSAGNKGVTELLRQFKTMNFIPSQITEARLIELMGMSRKTFAYGGGEKVQSAAYFYASEASNSLKTIYGDLRPCFTDWYDCGKVWDKGTQKDQEIRLDNICFNILAGCTFDFLADLIPEKEIMGGFASRLTYVVHTGKLDRIPIWGAAKPPDLVLKRKIFEDLTQIHNLKGKFIAEKSFQDSYVTWMTGHQEKLQNLDSEKMQAFLARKHVNILKLAMILSVCESNELNLKDSHWNKAVSLADKLEKQLPKILNLSATKEKNSNAAIVAQIQEELRMNPKNGFSVGKFRKKLFLDGVDPAKFEAALNYMGRSKLVVIHKYENDIYYKLP